MPRLAIIFVIVMLSGVAGARPRIAVAPIKGDSGGEIADAVAELLGERARVIKPAETEKAMDKLGIGELDDKSAKKLLAKLGADAVVSGKLEKKGKKKSLKLTLRAKGKDATTKTISYKSVAGLRDNNKDDVTSLASEVTATDEDEDKPKPKKHDPDEDRPKKKIVDEDRPKKKIVAEDDGDGEKKVRKKKRHDADDDKPGRSVGPAFRVDAGATYALRRLTYDSSSTNPPPTTGTAAPSGMVDVEAFPFAGEGKGGGAAGLGLYGGYDKTLGLSITIPGTAQSVAIDQTHYWVGARYRFPIGSTAAFGLGLGYDRRQFIANRSNLVNPSQLDTPDTDYSSVAPDVWLSAALTPKVTFVSQLDGLLLLSSGSIASSAQFGHATAYGVALCAGIDIAVADQFVFRLATEASQVSFSFNGKSRGVSAANDRSIGLIAALGVAY